MFHSLTAPAQYLPQFIPEFPARRQMLPPSLKKLYWSESGAQRNSATIQTAATPLHHATCMWIWRTQILWVSQPFASILATSGSTVGPEAASGSLPEMQSLHFMFGKIDSFYSSSLLEWKFGLKLFSWKKPSDLPACRFFPWCAGTIWLPCHWWVWGFSGHSNKWNPHLPQAGSHLYLSMLFPLRTFSMAVANLEF